jgi:hypothetical protein
MASQKGVFLSRGAQVGPDAAVAGRKIGVASRRSRWRFLWEWVDSKIRPGNMEKTDKNEE